MSASAGPDERFARVGQLLTRRGLRLATAESCTGGMMAAGFTAHSGASAYFEAGYVPYSNPAKERMLGVSGATLRRYGAVSEEVVLEMLSGALRTADIAVAITGVAGPGGGSEEKPIGTVWIAAGTAARPVARRFQFDGDRGRVRAESVAAALDLLETLIEDTL